jgi:epoxyqueuosine reductase
MSLNPLHSLTQAIKKHALTLGFDACGIARAERLTAYENRLKQWLDNGSNAGMGYMQNHFEKRMDPTVLVPGAKSVVVLAHNYYPAEPQHPEAWYKVAKYAYGRDYHLVIKEKLFKLLDFAREVSGQQVKGRVFTDSAPVLERAWAQETGIGFIGKNSCIILPRKGSFFFLSEMIIDLELEPDKAFGKDLCGSCMRCMDACPTGAITQPGVVDANRCISYLTIESKEDIPETFAGKCGQWIFGCDICQDVCPYNRFASPHQEPAFKPLPFITLWNRSDWESLTRETYNTEIKNAGSPLSRARFEKLTGNIRFIQKTTSP